MGLRYINICPQGYRNNKTKKEIKNFQKVVDIKTLICYIREVAETAKKVWKKNNFKNEP